MERSKSTLSVKGLVSVVIGIIVFCVVDTLIRDVLGEDNQLWITSPSGKTTRQLPFWTAMRVVRKQGWELADVEPVRPPVPPLSRWGHLKIALGWRIH